MRIVIEIPDDQVLRGVPREGFADYLAGAHSEAREQARQQIARAIRFQTSFVPMVTIEAEASQAGASQERSAGCG